MYVYIYIALMHETLVRLNSHYGTLVKAHETALWVGGSRV